MLLKLSTEYQTHAIFVRFQVSFYKQNAKTSRPHKVFYSVSLYVRNYKAAKLVKSVTFHIRIRLDG